jgi:hypothetical protein
VIEREGVREREKRVRERMSEKSGKEKPLCSIPQVEELIGNIYGNGQ